MEIKINVRKKHVYVLSALIVLVGSILFVQGLGSSNYGHDSDQVYVVVGGIEKNLQIAIDEDDLVTPDDVANGIGVSQTWTDVTSQRSLDTVYTNSGIKPIMISVTTWNPNPNVNGCEISVYVDNKRVARNSNNNDRFSKTCSSFLIIPSGSTYKVTSDPYMGHGGIQTWFELK